MYIFLSLLLFCIWKRSRNGAQSGHESGGRPEERGPYVSSGCPPLCCPDIGFDFWTQQVYPCTCGACGIMLMRGGSLAATNVQSLRHPHGRLVGTPQ